MTFELAVKIEGGEGRVTFYKKMNSEKKLRRVNGRDVAQPPIFEFEL